MKKVFRFQYRWKAFQRLMDRWDRRDMSMRAEVNARLASNYNHDWNERKPEKR